MDNFESKMTIKQKQLVDCGYATEEEVEEEEIIKNTQKALNVILGKGKHKHLDSGRKLDGFVTALCGK